MARPTDLLGLGFAAQAAELLGDGEPNSQNGTGTTQTGATIIRSANTELVASGGNTAFVLRSDAPVADPQFFYCSSATSAVVFVPSGHNLNGSSNGSLTIAQGKAAIFFQYKKSNWFSILTA